MREHRRIFPVEMMCRVFRVSNSGFYYWLNHPKGKRQVESMLLLKEISEIHSWSKKVYGSPRIAAKLAEKGIQASRPRVARIMRKAGIQSVIRKNWVKTTDSDHVHPVAANVLDRDFSATGLGEKWVSDLTYIRTGAGWVYLTTVIDLADRKVIGWALSDNMEARNTTVKAFQMARANRKIGDTLIFHSDQGVQYACLEFRQQLIGLPIIQSMSRKGNCWDNAVAESFFKTMKTEMVYQNTFKTKKQAYMAIFEYIEVWYNRKRIHSSLGYLTPLEVEKTIMNRKKAA
ncbi:IS3 family transposase [Pedobacter mucosus]|nr:IS3 family transposase [Pedobacter mucosus]UKT66151.1 IS3 family transposase [Pedobacter mucosus]